MLTQFTYSVVVNKLKANYLHIHRYVGSPFHASGSVYVHKHVHFSFPVDN